MMPPVIAFIIINLKSARINPFFLRLVVLGLGTAAEQYNPEESNIR
jgi:hypothetical protein